MIRKFLLVLILGLAIPYSVGAALEGAIKQPVRFPEKVVVIVDEAPVVKQQPKKIPNVAWF